MLYLWYKMIRVQEERMPVKKIVLPIDKTKRVTFNKDYIVVREENEPPVVFSSHCTHLGCIINKKEGDKLVCPCHGSQFDLEGNAVKGPAFKPLRKVPYGVDKTNGTLIIKTG